MGGKGVLSLSLLPRSLDPSLICSPTPALSHSLTLSLSFAFVLAIQGFGIALYYFLWDPEQGVWT